MSGEPWVWEAPDPDPVCGNCGSASWDDEKAACTACGDTIFDVAERIAAQTDPMDWTRTWVCGCGVRRVNVGWITCQTCGVSSPMKDALARAQAIRDHQTQGGPE